VHLEWRLVKSECSFYIGPMPRVSQDHLDNRRQQILDAATRCFARNGFHATSMQDVLAEANLSAGALYRYFRGKDEIIGAIALNAMNTVAGAFGSVAESDPLPPLPDLLAEVFATVERMDDENGTGRMVIQVWGEALRSPDLAEQITSRIRDVAKELIVVVERYQERGTISADVPAEYVARTIIALLPGFIVQRALLGDVTADMLRQGLRGLLGMSGE
jgi:TetR/AcrR family transcriptional regulator, transcriptional repressor of aconitase